MSEEIKKTRKTPRKFKIDTRADVQHYLAQVVRGLRQLKVQDKDLDPIRINKAKTTVYALSKLAELMATDGLEKLGDDILGAEVRRRARLAGAAVSTPATEAAPTPH